MGICGSCGKKRNEVVEPQPIEQQSKLEQKYNVEISIPPKKRKSPSQSPEDSLHMQQIVQIEKKPSYVKKIELALTQQTDVTLNPAWQSQITESESSVKLIENTAVRVEAKLNSHKKETAEVLELWNHGETISPSIETININEEAEERTLLLKSDEKHDDCKLSDAMVSPSARSAQSVQDTFVSFGSANCQRDSPESEHFAEITSFSEHGGPKISLFSNTEESSHQSVNIKSPSKVDVNDDNQSEPSIGVVYSDDFQAGESGTTDKDNPDEQVNAPKDVYKQESLTLSDVPTVPDTMTRPHLRHELMNLQNTFLEFRKMKFGHANSLLKDQEQTLMESTAEIHLMIQLHESTSDSDKQLQLEIIMERKFEALAQEFSSYQDMLTNDDESSMLLDMGAADLYSPLLDFDETSEDIPALEGKDLANVPLVSLTE